MDGFEFLNGKLKLLGFFGGDIIDDFEGVVGGVKGQLGSFVFLFQVKFEAVSNY